MTNDRANRILDRAAELMIEHEDWTIVFAVNVACGEDLFLYGSDSAEEPVGILGCSPLHTLRNNQT